jgi:hypothetical protein
MTRLHIWLIALVAILTSGSAAARTIILRGETRDAESDKRVYGGKLQIVNLSTGKPMLTVDDYVPDGFSEHTIHGEFFAPSRDTFDIAIRLDYPGYKPDSVRMHYPADFPSAIKDATFWVVPTDCELDAQTLIRLREVTVTATKVKMVMNGDTIVYNADAFNLPEGSLLDALVAQLPGTELNDKGEIRVNGEYVSSLLVDGKEFFKGDPTVALQNLPAYTVKNVKVYRHDESEGQYVVANNKNELPLVMDVRLKPEYQKGFLANVGVGYGTAGRYLGRAFALEYTRNVEIAAFFQTNNINSDASYVGSQGSANWDEKSYDDGRRRVLKSGLYLNWSVKKKLRDDGRAASSMRLGFSTVYTRINNDLETHTAATSFLPEGNRFSREVGTSRSRRQSVRSGVDGFLMGVPLGDKYVTSLVPRLHFDYNRLDNRASTRAAEMSINPEESTAATLDSIFSANSAAYGTRHDAIYRSTYAVDGISHSYNADARLLMAPAKATLNRFTKYRGQAILNWSFRRNTLEQDPKRTVNYFGSSADSDITSMLHTSNYSQSWSISPTLKQNFRLFDNESHTSAWILNLEEIYEYSHQRGAQDQLILDNPYESLADAAHDATNSYHSNQTTHTGSLNAIISYYSEAAAATLYLHGEAENAHLLYKRGTIDADVSRLRWKFEPTLNAEYTHHTESAANKFVLDASLARTLPALTALLPTTDNTNPLAIYLGNPDLKAATTLKLLARMSHTLNSGALTAKLTLGHDYYWNRRSTRRAYDSATGVCTYTPVNVNGAYDLRGAFDINARLDADNRFWLTSTTSATYEHIPDWMQENGGDDVLSTVRNTLLSENIRLNWTLHSGYSLTFGVNATWRNATSPMVSFTTINAADIAAKLAAQIQLPWKLQLGTDMTLYKRYGYGDASLNDASWVWNANLTRSFLAGRFLASGTAFDILGQLSNVTASINSLGRTETWTNSLRRYAMLTLTYRFSLMPRTAGSN